MSHEAAILPYIVAVLSAVFTILLAVLAWIGAQVYRRLDSLTEAVTKTNETLGKIDRDLRNDLSGLDRRVTKIEAVCLIREERRADACG